jgi:hypothetical protein
MKNLLLILCLTLTVGAFAEGNPKESALFIQEADSAAKDTTWQFNALLGLNFSQSYYSNWASGGQNSVSVTGLARLTLTYTKGKHSWENILDLAYGQMAQDGQAPIKTDDKIDFSSKYGYQMKDPSWYYSALLTFRTQFAPGYVVENGVEVGQPTSDFMAPAFQVIALGFDYMPNKVFSAFLTPVSVKTTYVTIERLAPEFGLEAGESVRNEFGAYAKFAFVKDVFENVNLNTRIDLFSNYFEDPQNVDVNWETLVTMKVNNWLSATLGTQLIYDDNTLVVTSTTEEVIDGETVVTDTYGPRLQFKEVFSLGLSASF